MATLADQIAEAQRRITGSLTQRIGPPPVAGQPTSGPQVGGPQTPPAISVPANPNAPRPEDSQRDAMAYIRSVLAEMGLESEADWAWSQIV